MLDVHVGEDAHAQAQIRATPERSRGLSLDEALVCVHRARVHVDAHEGCSGRPRDRERRRRVVSQHVDSHWQ